MWDSLPSVKDKLFFIRSLMQVNGGEEGIRTLGTLARTTVFETAPFDHSGISPYKNAIFYSNLVGTQIYLEKSR